MKRYIPLAVLVACMLLAGTSLTCKNIVRSLADLQLGAEETDYFKAPLPPRIYPPPPDSTLIVEGTVFAGRNTQEGAVCSLFYGSRVKECFTGPEGTYGFWCQACYVGTYRIKACYEGDCNRGPDCEGGLHQFYWMASMDPVHMDLCIGSGGPCPYPNCK